MRAITEWPVPSFYPCCRNMDEDAEASGTVGAALEMMNTLLVDAQAIAGVILMCLRRRGRRRELSRRHHIVHSSTQMVR